MIKASMKPVIDIKDICKQLNLGVTDFVFSLMAENKSYQAFDCSAKAEEALNDELIWAQSHGDAFHYNRIANEHTLVNLLRAQGFDDEILIYVHW